jgi:hypothetical protein
VRVSNFRLKQRNIARGYLRCVTVPGPVDTNVLNDFSENFLPMLGRRVFTAGPSDDEGAGSAIVKTAEREVVLGGDGKQ